MFTAVIVSDLQGHCTSRANTSWCRKCLRMCSLTSLYDNVGTFKRKQNQHGYVRMVDNVLRRRIEC